MSRHSAIRNLASIPRSTIGCASPREGTKSASIHSKIWSTFVTNAHKGCDAGRVVTGGLFGTARLHRFADGNHAIAMRSADYTHHPAVTAKLHAFHTINSAVEVDLKRAGFPPLSWYDVLLELRRAGDDGLRPLEIEARLLLAQHNVSRLIERLEKAKKSGRKASKCVARK